MSLVPVGFFRDLPHGHADETDLRSAVDPQMPVDLRRRVATYLSGGSVLAATSQRTRDVLDPEADVELSINTRTDGDFSWPEDLAYYVARYGVSLPPELVDRALGDPAPELDMDDLMALVRQVRGW